jgi:hypothetical protein
MANLIEIVRIQICRELDGFVREIDAFPDDDSVWVVVPGITNSAGTLALHVSGNLQHYVGHVLGGSSYVRARSREFSHRGSSRAELVADLRTASAVVTEALSRVSAAQLDADYPEPLGGHTINTAQFLVHLGAHLACHLGQAGYLRRVVTGINVSTSPLPLGAIATQSA